MQTLSVLLWKNRMVTKRKPLGFIFQMVYPLIFIYFLFLLRRSFKPKPMQPNVEPVIKYTVEKFPKITSSLPRCLLYTPNSDLAGILMDEVGSQLGLTRLIKVPNPDEVSFEPCRGYYPFTHYYEIANLVSEFHTNEALIIYEDMEAESWASRRSNSLTYTIRMKRNFSTHSISTYGESIPQDHSEYGENYEGFMRIQWAIDSSFIKIVSGNTVPQELSLQEFPYYRRTLEQSLSAYIIAGFVNACCWIGVMLLFTHVMTRMMIDRATGIQELIKLNGVSGFTLGASYFISSLPPALVFAVGSTVILKMSDSPLIDHTDGVIILIGLMLYAVSVIACGMAFSYLANTSQYATVLAIFSYTFTVLLSRSLSGLAPSMRAMALVTGLVPHTPVFWMLISIASFEAIDQPLTFGDISTQHSNTKVSVVDAYICLILQCLIFFMLTWYLSHVRQGTFGNSQPWYFCCKKGFWCGQDIKSQSTYPTKDESYPRDEKYFEKPPKYMEVGIRIVNVCKFYPEHKALDSIYLDVYKGEITVLLGHNGAGKTTLMSIISGMLPASKGIVYVNGVDSRSHSLKVRKTIGLCPQHNLFLPNLNVIEQVAFFHMLKAKTSVNEAFTKSMALICQLGIDDKAYSKPENLSGGMKRRLQLACALAGGSDVLVLDEPTSGLDVETRRELWNLLLSLRGGHTVLLSTHFMEEADALGDRVAALHTGQLKCHATPMYLKKAMGTGYRLSITTIGVPNETEITDVIRQHVNEATVREKTFKSITYNLPATAISKFPALFAALERDAPTLKRKCCITSSKIRKSAFGIDTIGLGVSTLEEAFLKLCSDTESFPKDGDCEKKDRVRVLLLGKLLYQRQATALYRRHVNFIKAGWFMFLLFNILVPGVLMYWLSLSMNNTEEALQSNEPDLLIDLSMYRSLPEKRVLLNINTTQQVSRRMMDKYADVIFSESNNIKNDLIAIGIQNIMNYNKYIIGLELDDQHAKALYTTVYRHAAPAALNLLSNFIASFYLAPTEDGERLITVHNHPLKGMVQLAQSPSPTIPVKDTMNTCLWAMVVCCIILFTSCNFQALPAREGVSGARHIHVMAGCPAVLHWFCTLTFHTALISVIMIPLMFFCAIFADSDDTLAQPALLITLSFIIILGSIAFFGFLYVLTLSFTEKTASLLSTFTVLVFAFIGPLYMLGTELLHEEGFFMVTAFLWITHLVLPPQTMTIAAAKASYVGRLNALCEANKENCPNFEVEDTIGFDKDKCCAGETTPYFAFNQYSPGKDIMILIAQGIIYMVIVVKIQKGYFSCLFDRVRNVQFKEDGQPVQEDELVSDEKEYVASEIKLSKRMIEIDEEAMLVSDLHKTYPALVRKKSVYAVRGISFSVKKGECFGLLGTNGAGKTTTFKMLTTEVCPSKGIIFGNNYYLHEDKLKYLRTISYCPQFLGIDDFQTGSDNLRTLLTIRGLDDKDINEDVKTWIDIVGLKKYENTVPSQYSGGYKRRLATAVALCAGAPLSLLDEPTAGVDVGARRRVHGALRKSLCQERSIVISSHSMDEMESLCARIAIMVNGKIRALGTPAELRSRHAEGYTVIFKVTPYLTESERSDDDKVDDLKKTMNLKFDCQLKDQHMTMLHYHIDDKIAYSDLFTQLELIRYTYPKLIEDYSVSETTLEEVFLALAKEDRDEGRKKKDEEKGESKKLQCKESYLKFKKIERRVRGSRKCDRVIKDARKLPRR